MDAKTTEQKSEWPWMDAVIALENPACTLSPMEEGKMMEQKTEY